jgi:hypothetical protein
VARQAATTLSNNPFVTIRHDRLRPKRDDALDVPPQVKELRRVIETHLPRIRIEELLMTVDRWCGFTQAFTPLSDAPSRSIDVSTALLAGRSLPMAPIWAWWPWATAPLGSRWTCSSISRRGSSAKKR